MKKLILISLSLILISGYSYAQKKKDWKKRDKYPDSSVDEKPPDLILNTSYSFITNPAFTGFEKRDNIRFTFMDICPYCYRKSSPVNGAISQLRFFNSTLTYNRAILKKRNLGIGIGLNHYQEGIFLSDALFFSSSYTFKFLQKNYFSVGLKASLSKRGIDFQKAKWFDMIEPRAGFVNASNEMFPSENLYWPAPYIGFDAGVFYNRDMLYCGLSIANINQAVSSYFSDNNSLLNRQIGLYTSYHFDINNYLKIAPIVNLRKNSNQYLLISSGLSASLLEILLLSASYEYNKTGNQHYYFTAGFTLFQSLLISSQLSLFAGDIFEGYGKVSNYFVSIQYQFGKTKKDLTKWRNF